MKLLMCSRNESLSLNIHYLMKAGVIIVHNYEQFVENLYSNLECIAFTSQAVTLFNSKEEFITLLESIELLFKYRVIYFSEGTDTVTNYLNSRGNCCVLKNLLDYSGLEILDNLKLTYDIHTANIKEANTNISKRYLRDLKQTLSDLELPKDEQPSISSSQFKDVGNKLVDLFGETTSLKRENALLASQKQNLLKLLDSTTQELKDVKTTYNTLLKTYSTNYQLANYQSSLLLSYQNTINEMQRHGINNISQDCFKQIEIDKTVYPVCVLYFKVVSKCKYLTSYLESLERIFTTSKFITRTFRLLPKYSTLKLKRFPEYLNTTNGLTLQQYATNSKFIHLGNPSTILNFMLSNEMPIDVLIIVDETPIDLIHCTGENVNVIYTSSNYSELIDYGITPILGIVNEQSDKPNIYNLEEYKDYESIKINNNFADIYYEQLDLTQDLIKLTKEHLGIK